MIYPKSFFNYTSLVVLTFILLGSCKKNEEPDLIDDIASRQAILSDLSSYVIASTYSDMYAHSVSLKNEILLLQSNKTEDQLQKCQNEWRLTRAAWEQSEGFLFGPVSTENIDPRIDTWPINCIDLDSILYSSVEFTPEYIDQLQDALKGFHPIEYLLFGINGNKTADQLSVRELSFLFALTENLQALCYQVSKQWDVNSAGNYLLKFKNAGIGSDVYSNQREAFEELVNAMIAICEEVASGKIGEPFEAQNPALEESPYAQNSMNDFRNNIQSVHNIYLGSYASNGKGIEDFVRVYNLSLDNQIKQNINQAIASLNAITDPFGLAIISQSALIIQAKNQITTLKETLENQLLPLVQQRIQ